MPTASTWAGASTAATGNTNWSDSTNWSTANGDVAPTASSTISTLAFPDLSSCDSEFQASGTETPSCYSSNNDLTGVTINTLNIDNPPASTYNGTSGTQYSPGYGISGNPVTLTGGLNVTGDSMDHSPMTFSIPLTVSGTQTWSMPGSTTDISSDVSGASSAVNVDFTAAPSGTSTNLQLDGHVDTSSFAVTGHDSTMTGMNSGNNGFLELNKADINGSNSTVTGTAGNPVTITDAAMVGAGSVGSLTVRGGDVNLADVMTYTQAVLTTGGATFDANSQIDFDLNGVAGSTAVTAGTDYSQLTGSVLGAGTGAIDLGGAAITLTNPNAGSTACVDPVPGTVYTLVQGTSRTGNVSFNDNGSVNPVPNGSVVYMQNCASTGNDQFRIDYTATAMTATALESTTTTLSATPASPQVNQSDVLTASVTAASGTPTGTVTFVENYGDNIPGCINVALDSAGQATCTTSFSNSGDPGVGAGYTPASGSTFAGSTGGPATPMSVQPIPGASSSTSSTASGSTTSATTTNPDNSVTATASGGQGTVTVSNYSGDPAAAPTFNSNGSYFDVQLAAGSTFTSLTISDPNMPSGGSLYWYNPSGGWQKIVGGAGSTQSPFNLVIDSTSSPTISQMTGTVFAVATPVTGYDLFAADGGVFNLGGAVLYGSKGGTHLNAPVVGGAKAKGGNGYYMVASDGGVFNFGPGAIFQGSKGGQHLNAPVVGMAVDQATGGYWLVAADGGVFNFNAPYLGSKGGDHLNAPIVGIAATPDGNGYYLVAADGGIFNFGQSATFHGSMGGTHLNAPVVGMAVDASTGGYWLVASDGGVFNLGGAVLYGSEGGTHLNAPVVGMTVDASTGGYWLVASDGGVFNFHAPYQGSMGGQHLNKPIVGLAEG